MLFSHFLLSIFPSAPLMCLISESSLIPLPVHLWPQSASPPLRCSHASTDYHITCLCKLSNFLICVPVSSFAPLLSIPTPPIPMAARGVLLKCKSDHMYWILLLLRVNTHFLPWLTSSRMVCLFISSFFLLISQYTLISSSQLLLPPSCLILSDGSNPVPNLSCLAYAILFALPQSGCHLLQEVFPNSTSVLLVSI